MHEQEQEQNVDLSMFGDPVPEHGEDPHGGGAGGDRHLPLGRGSEGLALGLQGVSQG